MSLRRVGAFGLEVDVDDGQRWAVAGVAIFVVAEFLLVSMGGAIIAAPATAPLMYLAATRSRRPPCLPAILEP